MPLPAPAVPDDMDAIAAALRGAGACRIAGLPDPGATIALREELAALDAAGRLAPASIGRGAARSRQASIRGDSTLWLDDASCGPAARAYLRELDALRIGLNRSLFLGLHEVEAHFARYPAGAGYARHRDRFRDDDARVLSLVSYLNADWDDADGGCLRLHLPDGTVDIAPHGGTSVCFLGTLEHEVPPARRPRLSIAAWFRRA